MNRDDVLSNVVVDQRGCWLWQGALNSSGYGPHVRVWTLWNGPPSPEAQLDHKCRVRRCVNPEHLREMSKVANWRAAWAFRHGRQMSRRNLRVANWLHKSVGES